MSAAATADASAVAVRRPVGNRRLRRSSAPFSMKGIRPALMVFKASALVSRMSTVNPSSANTSASGSLTCPAPPTLQMRSSGSVVTRTTPPLRCPRPRLIFGAIHLSLIRFTCVEAYEIPAQRCGVSSKYREGRRLAGATTAFWPNTRTTSPPRGGPRTILHPQTRERDAMSNHTYRVIEIVGSSPDGVDAAIRSGLARAAQTMRGLDWFEVQSIRGHLADGAVAHFQVSMKVGFCLEDS